MLISTGLPVPMCSSISESDASAPSEPRCSWSCSLRLIPVRWSDPAISQLVPADVPLKAGSETVLFSFPSIQKYVPAVPAMSSTTTTPMISAIRRP